MFYLRGLFLALITFVLTACGGSGKATFVEAPAFTLPNGMFDTDTGRFTSPTGLTTYSASTDPRLLDDGLPSLRQNAEGFVSIRAVSPNVFAIQSANIVSITNRNAPLTLGRFDDVQIPTKGSATLTGGYKGLWIANEGTISQTITDVITGDVNLTANFNGQTLSGVIENRRQLSFPGFFANPTPLNDLVLEDTSMNLDGELVLFIGEEPGVNIGRASGGSFLAPGFTGSGTYSFVLGRRNDATEVAAIVDITHRGPDGTTFSENGALIAFE